MSFLYLASPYTDSAVEKMQERYEGAVDAVATLAKLGITSYSPIVHFHPVALKHELPREVEFWDLHNRVMLKQALGLTLLRLEGWENSRGMQAEEDYAYTLRKPVWTWEPKDPRSAEKLVKLFLTY